MCCDACPSFFYICIYWVGYRVDLRQERRKSRQPRSAQFTEGWRWRPTTLATTNHVIHWKMSRGMCCCRTRRYNSNNTLPAAILSTHAQLTTHTHTLYYMLCLLILFRLLPPSWRTLPWTHLFASTSTTNCLRSCLPCIPPTRSGLVVSPVISTTENRNNFV